MDTLPYKLLPIDELVVRMNEMGANATPFLFIINYNADAGYIIKNDELDDNYIKWQFHGDKLNYKKINKQLEWQSHPVSQDLYAEKFNYVRNQILIGNSFLINLTQPTSISTNYTLDDICNFAYAPYKLWLKGQFLVLSPEIFVQIKGRKISTFPMKGTIDANLPDAEKLIMQDGKEIAEHATIVDLLRNDLSIVAEDVHVARYRYIDKIHTMQGDLLQVSSEITGKLPENYRENLGDIFVKLLPAGSICGAPKAKSLEIIREAENYDRGFYTGVCGYFDGENLDSAVMIRFFEQSEHGLVYKSGGGITSKSIMEKEYRELLQKIYVPVS
ncbi:aminodeoxychorismate synthase component I [Paludibacter sp.]